jgi:hypothetical protein
MKMLPAFTLSQALYESVWQLRFRSSGAKALTDIAGFMSWLKPRPTKIFEFSHRLFMPVFTHLLR